MDIAIIETGLEEDWTVPISLLRNLSVITNIGLDHMNLLGDSLEKIAGEKAGIIKAGYSGCHRRSFDGNATRI